MGFFPPAIFEIKAVAGQAIAQFQAVNAELALMEAQAVGAGAGLSTLDKASKTATAAVGVLGIAAVAVGVLSVKTALEVQDSYSRLGQAMANAGVNTEKNRKSTENLLDSYERMGFQNEVSAVGYQKLIQATHSVEQSNKLMAISADFARAKNIDLDVAAGLMAKGTQGSMKAMKELGITLDTTLPKNEAITKAFQELSVTVGGQAIAYTKTFNGQMAVLGSEVENVGEKIGTALIPILMSMIDGVRNAFHWLGQNKEILLKVGYAVGAVTLALVAYRATILITNAAQKAFLVIQTIARTAMALMTGQQMALNAAMAMNPIGLVVAAIALLAAGFIYLWNHSESFRKIVIAVGKVGVLAISFIIHQVGMLATSFLKIVTGPMKLFLKTLDALGVDAAGKALKSVDGVINTVGDFFEGASKKVLGFTKTLDSLENKKFSLPFELDFSGPKLKEGVAGLKSEGDIKGGLGTAGDVAKGGTKQSAVQKTISAINAKLVDVQKTYTDKMLSLQNDYAEKSAVIEDKSKATIADAQKSFNDTMRDLNAESGKAMAELDVKFAATKEKINSDSLKNMEKLEADHNSKILEIRKAGLAKLDSIVQQSIDRLRDAYRGATSTDVGKIFGDMVGAQADGGAEANAAGLLASLKTKLVSIKTLATSAAQLQGAGFSQTFIEQVVSAGPEVGNQLAKSIMSSSTASQTEMKTLFNDLEKTSNTGLDMLAKSMNVGGKLATDELTMMYQVADRELVLSLREQNQSFLDACVSLTKDFDNAMASAEKDMYDAQTAVREKHYAAMADAEKTRDEVISKASKDAVDSMADLQKTLASAQADARKSLLDSLTKIESDFDTKLGSIKTKVKSTIDEIKTLQSSIANAGAIVTQQSQLSTQTSSLGLANNANARESRVEQVGTTVKNEVTIYAQTNVDANELSQSMINALKFNTPILVSNASSNTGRRVD